MEQKHILWMPRKREKQNLNFYVADNGFYLIDKMIMKFQWQYSSELPNG